MSLRNLLIVFLLGVTLFLAVMGAVGMMGEDEHDNTQTFDNE